MDTAKKFFALSLLFVFLYLGCTHDSHEVPDRQDGQDRQVSQDSGLPKIVGYDEDCYFLDEQGDRFFPWGLNYTHTIATGFIDDQVQSDTVWNVIEQDFTEMKGYSANSVRIHLQYNRFMLDQWTPDPLAFEALERVVDIAEENGLYLLVTGLGAYRKADSPIWYDKLSTQERWDTQALFWKTVAGRIGNRNAVFAYDLMNEPVVAVCERPGEPCPWLAGEPFDGYYFVQNITIEEGKSHNEVMAAWIRKLTHAIRSEDRHTLITIGNLPIAPLGYFAEHLDFVSPHVYPSPGEEEYLLNYLEAGSKDRPLVIEEIFNLRCSAEELGDFLFAIQGKYRGLFGHYAGQTLEELADADDIDAQMWRNFLLFFIENNPNQETEEPAEP